MALFLLAFALLLAEAGEPGWRAGVPLGVLAAGTTYVYSFPGLAWLAGAAVVWGAIQLLAGRRKASGSRASRANRHSALVAVGVGVATLVLLMLPEMGRLADFVDFRALHPDKANEGGLGNLPGQHLAARGVRDLADERVPPVGEREQRARDRLLRRRPARPHRLRARRCRAGSSATARRSPRRSPRRRSLHRRPGLRHGLHLGQGARDRRPSHCPRHSRRPRGLRSDRCSSSPRSSPSPPPARAS